MASKMQQPIQTAPKYPAAEKSSAAEMTAVSGRRKRAGFGRRAFVVGATTGILCGVGAVVAPRAIPALEAQAQAVARASVLDEIGQLEDVSLDAAIRAAALTRQAVSVVVLPLARFMALIGNGALDLLLTSVDAARAAMSILHLSTTLLDAFRDVVVSWRRGVSALPITLDRFLTADIMSAETYLRALKRLADHPALR
jgi:hypothetical protein